jgi:hypothetical protein
MKIRENNNKNEEKESWFVRGNQIFNIAQSTCNSF